MNRRMNNHTAFACVALLLTLEPTALRAAAATTPAPRPDRFVQAVQSFADVALQYGRDTYGPKHTPLFVDGINSDTHQPVMWKARDGHAWALSDLGNQQNFFRTLVGLSALTGDPHYKQAAVDATRYALTNLMEGGFLAWGGHMAYNASDDIIVCAEDKGRVHELKNHFPFYRQTKDRTYLQAAERVGDLLGVPRDKTVRILLPLGVAAESGKQRERLPFDRRASFNRYGS